MHASISATLSWSDSPDPTVTGYHIYYGSASHSYTNMISVVNATSVVISGLAESTTYYFAAKSVNAAGAESAFSNEAAFAGVNAMPNGYVIMRMTESNVDGDPLVYSLVAGAPPGVAINPTNGVISWMPGLAYACTTNYVNVLVTDTVNPSLSTYETLAVVTGDYLNFQLGGTAVYAGLSNSLPLTVVSSSTLTNLQVTFDWPVNSLLNPVLTTGSSNLTGSVQVQGNRLVVELQTVNVPLSGSNQVAQVNFQAAPGQPSTILTVPVTSASGITASGNAYANVLNHPGEVLVVGTQPILRPQATPVLGRTLSVFANPGTYQLQYATSLTPSANWLPLTIFEQKDIAQTLSLDSSNPVVFYRLRQL